MVTLRAFVSRFCDPLSKIEASQPERVYIDLRIARFYFPRPKRCSAEWSFPNQDAKYIWMPSMLCYPRSVKTVCAPQSLCTAEDISWGMCDGRHQDLRAHGLDDSNSMAKFLWSLRKLRRALFLASRYKGAWMVLLPLRLPSSPSSVKSLCALQRSRSTDIGYSYSISAAIYELFWRQVHIFSLHLCPRSNHI